MIRTPLALSAASLIVCIAALADNIPLLAGIAIGTTLMAMWRARR